MATRPTVVVVFDANIWIGASVHLERAGWPANWATAPATQEEAALFAISAASGLTPDLTESVDLLVYGSEDLDDVILRKLSQPADRSLPEHLRGLGYPDDEGDRLYATCALPLDDSGRSFVIDPAPGEMPLSGADYEDRCIWGLFRAAIGDRPDADALLVTHDRAFALQINAFAPEKTGGGLLWAAVSGERFCHTVASYR